MMTDEERVEDSFRKGRITFSDSALRQYEKSNGIAGNHSGVQICHWTRSSLRGGKGCYKVKFYGVDCHRCCQMSPALAWCNEACVFCWRPMEWMKKTKFEDSEVDEPAEIIEKTVKARRKLVSGFGGFIDVHKARWKESFQKFPSHWAISLSGEPTIYPKLGEMVKRLREHPEVKTIFIVTNGQEPERIGALERENALPTQLYVSLAAPNEELFKKINRSVYADGWERFNRTLELLASLEGRCRRAIRFTLIKGVNDSDGFLPQYAALIEKSRVDFLEVKSYMALGFSRKRLGVLNMLEHPEVVGYSKKLAAYLPNYSIVDHDEASRIVLLKRKDSKFENIIRSKDG